MSYRDATMNAINVNTSKNIKIVSLNIKTNYVKKKALNTVPTAAILVF